MFAGRVQCFCCNLVRYEINLQNGAIGVDSLARQAIKFLHTCFDNKHPRMRGQTLAEVSELLSFWFFLKAFGLFKI